MLNVVGNLESLCSAYYENTKEKSVLSVLRYYMEKEDTAKQTVSVLNTNINGNDSWHKGLTVLNELVEICPHSIFQEHCSFWLKSCCSKNGREQEYLVLKLELIGKILKTSIRIPDFEKQIILENLPQIIELCSDLKVRGAFKCLIACFQNFPSTCLPYKNKLEVQILKYLGNSNKREVAGAAKAFHFLQQVGGAGLKGINHIENWSNNFKKLCGTVENLFDILFDGFEELNKDAREEVPHFTFAATLPSEQSTLINKYRIINCLIFMRTMLNCKYSVVKLIPMKTLVEVLRRGLSMHICISQKSYRDMEIAAYLLEIQAELLSLLRSTFHSLRKQLLPFGLLLTQTLIDCLLRVRRCYCFVNNRAFHIEVYNTLELWITLIGNGINKSYHEKIIALIIKDTEQQQKTVKLTLEKTKESRKRKSDKKSTNVSSEVEIGEQSFENTSKGSERSNEIQLEVVTDVASAALKCLEKILCQVNLKLSSTTTTDLYKFVVKTITTIQSGEVVRPFYATDCVLSIYNAMIFLFEQPLLPVPLPLDVAISLLKKAQNSENTKLSEICRNGLSVLEKICQPICPTLGFTQNQVEEDDFDLSHSRKESAIEDPETVSIDKSNFTETERPINILSNIVVPNKSELAIETSQGKYSISEVSKDVIDPESTNKAIASLECVKYVENEMESESVVEEPTSKKIKVDVTEKTKMGVDKEVNESMIIRLDDDDENCVILNDVNFEETQAKTGEKDVISINESSDSDENLMDSFVDEVNEIL